MLFCFTDLIPDAAMRSSLGMVYLGISFSNIFIHIVLLLFDQTRSLFLCTKRRYRVCKLKGRK